MVPQLSQAKRMARNLLREADVDGPPVPVYDLLVHCGAKIRYDPSLSLALGMVCKKDGETIVGINSYAPWYRQKFAAAHALGHLILHPDECDLQYDDRKTVQKILHRGLNFRENRINAEADTFAEELLLPEPWLLLALRRMPETLPANAVVHALACQFKMPRQVITYRLASAGIAKSLPHIL